MTGEHLLMKIDFSPKKDVEIIAFPERKLTGAISNLYNETYLVEVRDIGIGLALLADLSSAPLDVGSQAGRIATFIGSRHDPGRVGEEVVHLFKRKLLGLGEDQEEEKCVCEIADGEEDEEAPSNGPHGNICDLANHGVEGKRDHGRDRHALGAGVRVEDLGGDDPGERTGRVRKRDVVEPGAGRKEKE